MTSAIAAWGTVFKWHNADPAEITRISGPSESMDPIDVTSHDSVKAFREFLAGIHDGGEITIEGNFLSGDADQILMHTDFQASTIQAWEIRFPGHGSGPEITGNGFITAFSWDFPYDGPVTFSVTIKVSGVPAFSAA